MRKQVFYRANRNHPIFSELRALVAKTVGAIPALRSALAPLAGRISVAFIYGSMARGEEKGESDIDLLIVGKAELEDVIARLGNIEASLRRPVNPTVYSPAEFRTKLASGNHFLNSVVRSDKAFLIGDEDELKLIPPPDALTRAGVLNGESQDAWTSGGSNSVWAQRNGGVPGTALVE